MKKILFLSIICALTICGSFFLSFGTTGYSEGATDASIYGFAFSSNIGWISFHSRNCDIDSDGTYESGALGGCPTSGSVHEYGVSIAQEGGFLSGYAWSPHIGWISFNEGELAGCPSGQCRAKLDGTSFSGWAKALAAEGDGWDGWIRLSGSNYGLTVNGASIEGQMWGGEVVGWIDSYNLTTNFEQTNTCNNGIDDDNDGPMDSADNDCDGENPTGEDDPDPQCNNAYDDDGDGQIDYPNDPDCTGPTDPTEGETDAPEVVLKVGIGSPAFEALNIGKDGANIVLGIDISNASSTTLCSRRILTEGSSPVIDTVSTGGATVVSIEQDDLFIDARTTVVVSCTTAGKTGSDSVEIIIKEENEF